MKAILLVLLAAMLAAPLTAASDRSAMIYPDTARQDLVEDHFGTKVPDPYRWLEADVRVDKRVSDWVAAQNAVTGRYLESLPGRDALRGRMRALMDYERFGVPRKAGSRYFYTRNSGLQNQSPLYVRDGLGGAARLLIDPNGLSKDGATAMAEWEPAPGGRHLVYAVQDGGTDWRILRVIDVDSGETLDDRVEWVKYSDLSWDGKGEGFFYSRFAAPPKGAEFQSTTDNQKLYYHRVGTPQSADRLIYETPKRPALGHSAQVTKDGRWLVILSSEGTDPRYELTLGDLSNLGSGGVIPTRTIVRGLGSNWDLVGSRGDTLYFITDRNAPRGRLVAFDARRANPRPVEIVAQARDTLTGGRLIGERFILAYLHDAATEAHMVELDGRPAGPIVLPGIGTASGFGGRDGDPETFYAFSGYTTPATIYRFDSATGQSSVFAAPRLAFDPAAFVTEQVFYASKDGTRIPMFIVRRNDIAASRRAAPTLLYGYGGFNIALTPEFSATRMAWIEQGGVLAVANLRGGAEYGNAWHDAGRLAKKQNVFDDFIAAAEYLKASGITGEDQLAIEGRSNGGLLVGAVVNQRPELFAAALPAVGVMDMLRFHRFTAGRYWIDDYGDPGKKADFRILYGYSPYHNIRPGIAYPPVLVTTADTDDRVVPGHSFKYIAALQAARAGDKPHLIRIETRAGHGSGKPTDKAIEEFSDVYAFAAHWTGLELKAKP